MVVGVLARLDHHRDAHVADDVIAVADIVVGLRLDHDVHELACRGAGAVLHQREGVVARIAVEEHRIVVIPGDVVGDREAHDLLVELERGGEVLDPVHDMAKAERAGLVAADPPAGREHGVRDERTVIEFLAVADHRAGEAVELLDLALGAEFGRFGPDLDLALAQGGDGRFQPGDGRHFPADSRNAVAVRRVQRKAVVVTVDAIVDRPLARPRLQAEDLFEQRPPFVDLADIESDITQTVDAHFLHLPLIFS